MITSQTEVLVCGGGPAGFAAAVASVRLGVKALLVERYGFLGGMATAGLVNPFMISKGVKIGGVFQEVIERLKKENACKEGELFDQPHIIFDPEILKLVLFEMVEEAKVKLLLHSLITGAIVKGKEVKGIILENKSGQSQILAKVIIDATGDGDVAALAGASFEKSKLLQPMTLNFRVGGVEEERMPSRQEMDKLFREANLSIPREKLLWFETVRKGEIHFNTTRISTEDLTQAEIEGRKQVKELMEFLKSKVSGFEKAYLLSTGVQVGVRESRRILGEYVLTEKDILEGRKFTDVIARGSYPIDIHEPKGKGVIWKPLRSAYDIPYRCLAPKSIDNLLVAGRSISVTHEALSSVRVIPTCMALGEAAGVAAALAVKEKISPRKVAVSEIQKVLIGQGSDLGTPVKVV